MIYKAPTSIKNQGALGAGLFDMALKNLFRFF